MRWPGLAALGGILLLLYTGIALTRSESTLSPGHLLEGHSDLAESCFRCHAPFRGVDQSRCVECHGIAEIGIRSVSGAPLPARERDAFHDRLRPDACTGCHTDHEGSVSNGARPRFEHRLLRRSAQTSCQDCHASETPADTIHKGAEPGCASCHQALAWTPARFEHDRYFRFDRHHAASCRTCHTTPGDLHLYTCYGCHEHSPRGIRGEHLEEGIRDFEACENCHRSANEHEAERRWHEMRRQARGEPGPEPWRDEDRRIYAGDDSDSDSD